MINNLTTLEQVTIIAQGFAKIAYNFWPVIVLGLVGVVIVARQESRAK